MLAGDSLPDERLHALAGPRRIRTGESRAAAQSEYEVLSDTPIEGEGCFTGRQADDLIFSWAVEDALQKAGIEGATALVDATYTNHIEDKGSCLKVSGLPARRKAAF